MTGGYRPPERMTDRWRLREDQRPGEGVLYWHALLGGDPAVRDSAAYARERLDGLPGLHHTPPDRLHMTMERIGPVESLPGGERDAMVDAVRSALGPIPVPAASLGTVLYHPEAVILVARPFEAFAPVHDAVVSALPDGTAEQRWIPHVTLAYSTADQPAAPLIEALGHAVPERTLELRSVSLVAQWGPEREWNWEELATVPVGPGS